MTDCADCRGGAAAQLAARQRGVLKAVLLLHSGFDVLRRAPMSGEARPDARSIRHFPAFPSTT